MNTIDFTKALLKPKVKVGREFTQKAQTKAQVYDLQLYCRQGYHQMGEYKQGCHQMKEFKENQGILFSISESLGEKKDILKSQGKSGKL